MKFSRKGMSLVLVIASISAFFTIVVGLLRQSSGELKHTKHIIAKQCAEMLALSGIDWGEMELRKGRWYQAPYGENPAGGRPTFGIKQIDSPLETSGKLTIVCQDIPNNRPASNVHNMQQFWYLHHIGVFSLGEISGAKCLVYGKYIISPEPALNSDSTEADEYVNSEFGSPFISPVRVKEVFVSGTPIQRFTVKKIFVSPGQKVDINTPVAKVAPVGGTSEIDLHPETYGTVKEILLKEGETCDSGQTLCTLSKMIAVSGKPSAFAKTRTLKKMVRITKIDLAHFPNFDISNLADRLAVSNYVDQLSDAYLINFVSHNALETAIENLDESSVQEKLKDTEIFKTFPAGFSNMTKDRAENIFLTYLIKNFTSPGCKWEKRDEAQKESHLALDHKKTEPPDGLRKKLDELGLFSVLQTKPRKDERYYHPKMAKGEFLQLLTPQFNLPVGEFMNQLSQLPDASRMIDITEGTFSVSSSKETENSILITKADATPNPVQVSVQKLPKPYSFVDPVNEFTIRMSELTRFLKKYYSNEGSVNPKEPKRVLEHIDWPLPKPPGAPPATPEGYQAVWKPGVPGIPPGPPTWSFKNGKITKIPYPTAGTHSYENPGGTPDQGVQVYEVPGQDPINQGDSNVSSANPPSEESDVFSQNHPPISVTDGGAWQGTPGSPGIPPTEGQWQVVPVPEPGSNEQSKWCSKCSSCCFAPGTMITMADRSTKPIETVKPGDEVLTYDESGKTLSTCTVNQIKSPVRNHLTTLFFLGRRTLQLTNEHPLMTQTGWAAIDPQETLKGHSLKVGALRVGDRILDSEGKWIRLDRLETQLLESKVYNLEKLEPYHCYFANGFLAHNKGEGANSAGTPGNPGNASAEGVGNSGVSQTPTKPGQSSGVDAGSPGVGDSQGIANGSTGGPGVGNADGRAAQNPGNPGKDKCPNCGGPSDAGRTAFGSNNPGNKGGPGNSSGTNSGGPSGNPGKTSSGSNPSGSNSGSSPAQSYKSYSGGV